MLPRWWGQMILIIHMFVVLTGTFQQLSDVLSWHHRVKSLPGYLKLWEGFACRYHGNIKNELNPTVYKAPGFYLTYPRCILHTRLFSQWLRKAFNWYRMFQMVLNVDRLQSTCTICENSSSCLFVTVRGASPLPQTAHIGVSWVQGAAQCNYCWWF